MKNKTITLDGIEYNLVPVEENVEKDNTDTVTFYYSCDSNCGFFQFSILLNDDGEIWEGTQSVTYYPEGGKNENNMEVWDNNIFLVDLLEEGKNLTEATNLRKKIGDTKFISLINILHKVHEKGWI
jgi:PKD repeat protein